MINNKDFFEIPYIEYDQIKNQSLLSYLKSTISCTMVDFRLIITDHSIVSAGGLYMPRGWRREYGGRRKEAG